MRTHQFALPLLMAAIAAVSTIDGCSSEPHVAVNRCSPDPLYPGGRCPDDSEQGDAGLDAEPDGPTLDPQATSCPGRCVPMPEGPDALLWSRWPDLLLFSSTTEPEQACPGNLALQLIRYADLEAPPATCDICDCEKSKGTCTGLPADIKIRAGSCNDTNASTLPFEGPPGWDGSCTSANGIPTGAKCPEGSSTFCAQSLPVGVLPGPATEACAVKTQPVPTFWKTTKWKTRGISCRGNVDELRCGEKEACVHDLPLPWLQCVWRQGRHKQCPTNYPGGPVVTYPETAIEDSRSCTNCECGPPVGSACLATIRLYDDTACTLEFSSYTLASYGDQCGNIYPSGRGIAGKAITDMNYVGGTCLASGGEPVGEANGDDEQAISFCCLPGFDIAE